MSTPPETDPLAFAKSIEGWMSPAELRWIYETGKMFAGGSVVEVGVWKGRSLAAFAAGMQTGTLVGVDNMSGRHSWNVSPTVTDQRHGLARTIAVVNATHPNLICEIFERDSVAASEVMGGPFDAVFIDGDHRAGYVEADILAWAPRVKPRGIICGHDYNEREVRDTVDRLLLHVENSVGSIWWHVKGP